MGTREKPGGLSSTSGPGDERRRAARRSRDAAYLISPVSGVVTDVGPGGFCVETWEPLTIKRRYSMVIGEGSGRAARLPCRVEWCRLVRAERTDGGEVVSVYRLGVSYLTYEELRSPAS